MQTPPSLSIEQKHRAPRARGSLRADDRSRELRRPARAMLDG
jgi:hypothetical protein